MDAETAPSRSLAGHMRSARCAAAFAMRQSPRSTSRCRRCALPAASPSPAKVVCAECWSKLSFIAKPRLPAARHPLLSTIPAPSYFSMRQSLVPPAYTRACAAMRYDEVTKTLVLH